MLIECVTKKKYFGQRDFWESIFCSLQGVRQNLLCVSESVVETKLNYTNGNKTKQNKSDVDVT